MLDNKYDRLVKGKKTGKLHTKSLYKVNQSDKLFAKKEERKNKHYAVSLVIDCSGSMSGERLNQAVLAAKTLSKNFSQMGIPHNVVCFDELPWPIRGFQKGYMHDIAKKIDAFRNGVYYCQIKEEDKQFAKEYAGGCRYKLLGICEDSTEQEKSDIAKRNGITVDRVRWTSSAGTQYHTGIACAIEGIRKQKGKRIVVCLSDGDTNLSSSDMEVPGTYKPFSAFTDLKKVISDAIKEGIEMYGVGIHDDAGNQYFPETRTCAVYNTSQLYDHIIKMIKINLKRG